MTFFKSRLAKLGMAISWVAAIGGTQAYSEGSYYDAGYTAATQNSTVVTERRVVTVATEAQANMVLSQISERLEGGAVAPAGNSVSLLPQNGGNAGAMGQRSSIWARAGYDNMKEDNITRFGGWKANLWTLAIGYDHKINDKVLAGLALTYSNLDGSTAFNKGNIKDNAYGLVPYVAFLVAPCFDVNVMVGYSRVNKSRDRGTAANNTDNNLSGGKATSKPKSDRYFGAIYANLKRHVNRWNLLGRLGYWYATDRQKAFSETNGQTDIVTGTRSNRQYSGFSTNLNRLSLRLQAGYKASQAVEPYAFLTYARDFGATKINVPSTFADAFTGIRDTTYVDPNTRRSNNTFGGGLGLNACLNNGWSTGLEANYARSKKFQNIGGFLRLAKKF